MAHGALTTSRTVVVLLGGGVAQGQPHEYPAAAKRSTTAKVAKYAFPRLTFSQWDFPIAHTSQVSERKWRATSNELVKDWRPPTFPSFHVVPHHRRLFLLCSSPPALVSQVEYSNASLPRVKSLDVKGAEAVIRRSSKSSGTRIKWIKSLKRRLYAEIWEMESSWAAHN